MAFEDTPGINPNDPTAGQDADELAGLGITPGGTPRSGISSVEPTIPGLDPDILARLSQTKEQAREAIKRKILYHMKDGQKEPDKKQKALGVLQTIFAAAMGAPTPQAQARKMADKDYTDETARIGQNVGEQRVNQATYASQLKAAYEQQLAAIKAEHEKNLSTYQGVLGQAKTSAAESAAIRAKTDEAWKQQMAVVNNKNADTRGYMASIAALKDPLVQAQLLDAMPPEDRRRIFGVMETQSIIKGLPRMMGVYDTARTGTSYDDVNGTHSQTFAHKVPRIDPMGLLQQLGLGGGGGLGGAQPQAGPQAGPQQAPQQTGAPVMPPAAPQTAPQPTRPPVMQGQGGGPQASMPDMINALDVNGGMVPGKRYPKGTLQAQLKAGGERQEEIRKLQDARTNYGLLTNALIDAGVKGDNFRGAMAGSNIAQTLRKLGWNGDVSSPEALDQVLQNFGTMGSLKGVQPRFSTAEYNQAMNRSGGAPSVSLPNAVRFAVGHTLRTEMEEGIRSGKYKPEDAPRLEAALSGEMDRVSNAVKELEKAKGKEKLDLIKKGRPQVRPLAEILKDAKTPTGGTQKGAGRIISMTPVQ